MVQERNLGTHLIVPVVLRLVGPLIILQEGRVEATGLVATGQRGVEQFVAFRQIPQGELRGELGETQLAVVHIHRAAQLGSPCCRMVSLVVLVRMLIVEAQTHLCLQTSHNVQR